MEALVHNKKAGFEYEILEKYTAGIELEGHEVKALREKKGSLIGAYVGVRGGEAYVLGMFIPPYQEKNTPSSYDAYQARRLLLTKKELQELIGKESVKGLTIVPISVYNAGRKLKMTIALVKKKKQFDKRETIKKKTAERDVARTLKNE